MKYFFLFILIYTTSLLQAQTPKANELTKLHEVTTAEMNSIDSPEAGSLIFNTTENKLYYYNGTEWVNTKSDKTVYAGHFIISGTGLQTITGLPFEPSSIVFSAHANIETTTINADNAVGNNSNTLANAFGTMSGYARNDNGSINQQVIYVGGNGNSINDISRYANPTQCIGIRYANQNGDNLGLTTASLTTVTNGGFTINVSNHSDDLVVLFTAYE
ncbi:hypothetical protein KO500_07870 [Cellulophaga baltica]|uniref:hypothetical protein n=1 Tax=Cellulophaga TaxID=104264 RepID=UPI001C068DE4|nr:MULTISPECIES: hypothetical protein [Cellulophaga]MBU2996347.1 hypothetical protein [Cellulophaga baltica]MDO6767743.1 hypothetical protein [Cellulophaga sp. 1_MG-2023]